jgi:DNA-binding transcriptional LysR family regulator
MIGSTETRGRAGVEQRSVGSGQPLVVGQDDGVDFDLSQIRAFVAAAEELHFGRAAARLFLSQQGLSKRIQRLEQMVGAPLFVRQHNLVELTATGRRFLPHARRLLATAEETAAELWPQARPLRIDVWGQVHAPLRIVGRLAAQLPELLPELSMRRSLSAALDALERDELDVAFGRPYDLPRPPPPGLALQPVRLDPLAVVMAARHPHADAEVLTPEDLRSTGLWWPLENSQGEVAGFIGRYGAQFAIPIATDGLNLGVDHFLDALRADPTRVSLIGSQWPLSSTDGITIVELRPVPRFLWWVAYRKHARHPQLGRFLSLLEETARREGWLGLDPDRDWLPDADRADLLAWTAAAPA